MENKIPATTKTTHPTQSYQRKLVSVRRIARMGRLAGVYTVLAVGNATVVDSTAKVKHYQVRSACQLTGFMAWKNVDQLVRGFLNLLVYAYRI